MWVRPIEGTSQEWVDLPSGTYQLVLLPDSETATPRDVGEIVLAPGDDRRIDVELPVIARTGEARRASKEGASVSVRVRSSGDLRPLRDVVVSAVRAHELAAMRRSLEVERATLATATTGSDGWARLTALPEENLVLVIQRPARANPHVTEPYRFAEGEDTILEDILLDLPANVFVSLSMPDHLSGKVELTRVELFPAGHTHWPEAVPIRGVVTAEGGRLEDVPAGSWTLRAGGKLKDGFALNLAEKEIEVLPGVDRQVALTLTDSLYHGRVTRGGAPVSGSINLKPAGSRSGRRDAVATLGADGTFDVLLEREGEYVVHVQERNRGGVALSRYVTFGDPAKDVAIELPDGRIEGRVVDAGGMPVAGAAVHAAQQFGRPAGASGAISARDGRFTLDSVEPGSWLLSAETADARSEAVTVSYDRSAVDGVTLILEPIRVVQIRLVDTSGVPVRRGFVSVQSPRPNAAGTDDQVQTSDQNGIATFRLKKTPQVAPVNVVVATPDLRLSCAMRHLDRDQVIAVPASAGEVRITRPASADRPGVRPWLVSAAGCSVPFLGVRSERDGSGALLSVFPSLAAGTWTYVETASAQEFAAVVTGRGNTLLPKIRFDVEPSGTTTVVVPGN